MRIGAEVGQRDVVLYTTGEERAENPATSENGCMAYRLTIFCEDRAIEIATITGNIVSLRR